MASKKRIEKYVKFLENNAFSGDWEVDHGVADDALCDLLDELGYKEVVNVYTKVGKWYA